MDLDRQSEHRQLGELLDHIRTQLGLDVAFGGDVNASRDGFVISCVSGDQMNSLLDLDIVVGTGLGGKALMLAKPVSVIDYHHANGITHHYDQAVAAARLRSVFAIPVLLSGAPRAMVYGALRHPTHIGDMRLSQVHRAVKRFEFDLRVREQVRRELTEIDAESSMSRMRERLRDIYTETMAIAEQISDPVLKQRVQSLSERARSGVSPDAPSLEAGTRPGGPLTKRELDVAVRVSAGHTNAEVAQHLGLVPSTVKSYLKSAMRKLAVRNRMEFVAECRRLGLIP